MDSDGQRQWKADAVTSVARLVQRISSLVRRLASPSLSLPLSPTSLGLLVVRLRYESLLLRDGRARYGGQSGTAYMLYDGAFANGDGTTLEIVFLFKDLDVNGAVIQRIINNNGPRLDIRMETNGRLHFIVKNTTGTDLIDWTASSTMKGAGAWLIRIAADTSGTPSFAVSRAQITVRLSTSRGRGQHTLARSL